MDLSGRGEWSLFHGHTGRREDGNKNIREEGSKMGLRKQM